MAPSDKIAGAISGGAFLYIVLDAMWRAGNFNRLLPRKWRR